MQPGERDPSRFHALSQGVKRVLRRFNLIPPPHDHEQSTNTQQLLYRLHLHQVELEMQNEELRRTQLALEDSQTRYIDLLEYTSALYNQAPIGYLTLTDEGIIVEANLTAVDLLGVQRERLLQQPLIDFIGEEDHDKFNSYCAQLLAVQQAQRCEVRMMCADKSHFFVQMDATVTRPLLGPEMEPEIDNDEFSRPQYIRITISDISVRVHLQAEERKVRAQLEATLSDLRQAQAQMVKQERLAVVGQLAAGIAHDFNNILAAITLYAQLVMRSPELPSKLQARMDAIVAQSNRASLLIQQILDFSRRTIITRQSTALSEFLQQLLELMQHTMPDTIQVSLEIDSLHAGVDDVVEMDSGRIQQVLLNLALNARDAMPAGGELRFTLARIVSDGTLPTVASGSLPIGTWLRIGVSDTGVGIQPEDLPHIFEPFFTTKNVGQGSGLGLSQVWGIVTQHEGEIDVTSQVGKGSAFSLYLPALSVSPPAFAASTTKAMPDGHGEMVIVVEDNDELRTALISAVTQLGYQTLAAKNGQEAATLMNQKGEDVTLILTDLLMPVMGGEELIRTLRAQSWQQPIVVLSGQPLSAPEIEQLQGHGQISWLIKPPALEQLARTLNQALHSHSSESC